MSPIRSVMVIEDEPAISSLVAFHLEQQGYEAITAAEGRRALALIEKKPPTLVILDIMLPDIDGIEVLRRLRTWEETKMMPVILLTARAEENDRIQGLEIGADDYVTKPFSPRELMLRVQKLIHSRENLEESKAPTVFGCLELQEEKFRVLVEEKPIEVSATEMRLLVELLRSRGMVMSRNQILQSAWGYMPNVTERTVDTHIKRLRQKLGPASAYLETVRGVGYRWLETPPPAETKPAKGAKTGRV